MPPNDNQPQALGQSTSPLVDETLQLSGALNLAAMPRLLAESAEFASRDNPPLRLIIDFSGVTEVDSSGVALLLHWRRMAQKLSRELRYINLPPNLASLAELYGVGTLIHCPAPQQ